MPVYELTYTRASEGNAINRQHEWIVPAGWTDKRIIENFEQRYQGAKVTGLLQVHNTNNN